MAIIQLYSHPETRVFKSSICSKATFFSLIAFFLFLLPPFFIAFAGRTFWLKEDYYRDSPVARFAHKVIVILDGVGGGEGGGAARKNSESDYRLFSTFANLNLLHGNKYIPASITLEPSSSSSSFSSSSSSSINVKISLHPGADFRVRSVTALIFFNYDLLTFTRLSMEGMAFLQRDSISSSSPSGLWVDGEMRLKLISPLPHRGSVTQFNSSVVNETASSLDELSLKTILKSYKDREFRLHLEDADYLWNYEGRSAGNFVVESHFRFPEERVSYRPGIAQMLKWAWIQYLSIFAIFYFVIERMKAFVFLNQIIPTIVEGRWDKVKRH